MAIDLKQYFKDLDRIDELKEKREKGNITERVDAMLKIMDLEHKYIDFKFAFKYLSEEDKKYIFLKFKKKLSAKELANIFHVARSTLYRREKRMIKQIEEIINL
ncbi:hypothetical protein AAGC94_22540 [Clostridium sporogenes]|uniref:hypothetical protein n=1 Tax=Clostridium TaxID=1485 RepID=UPI0004538625|nr:hypothetical protein [Clostridium tetanomorphum]KAJ49102.1 hypothetical protein CTM_24920 [Clostridium tetanomorphum DSM 665]KAJ49716.1 hypothetical protein CTM_21673 [Clostridium tetanomorphum DSM 665]MBP1866579.1 DNA-directed RNA polymerase specialized sigma subunit [Clostridium tetanomorphum]NRS86641.1 DNA-directed RNA polymerase specialized sigma subunit [Clostridium tetanomorphum]SQC01757.1 phage protein [Clostridium tetanomorphum]